jgi:hypothetical protein
MQEAAKDRAFEDEEAAKESQENGDLPEATS